MTLRGIVKELQQQGKKVAFRVRPDGGIVITQIDGINFKGRSGNEAARVMAGSPLPEYMRQQRREISSRGVYNRVTGFRYEKVSDKITAKLKAAQRAFKKKARPGSGKPTIENIRARIRTGYSENELLESLDNVVRYSKNIAFLESVVRLQESAVDSNNKLPNPYLEEGIALLEKVIAEKAMNASNEDVGLAAEALYSYNQYANIGASGEAMASAAMFVDYVGRMV